MDDRDSTKILFRFNAENSEKSVEEHSAEKYKHLPAKLYLQHNSNIILKENLWKEAGLFNGSRGIVKDFIYSPEDKLVAVLIKFDKFIGKGIGPDNLVPIEPKIIENKHN